MTEHLLKTAKVKQQRLERAKKMYEMKLDRFNYRQIGETFNITRQRANQLVKWYLAQR